jgi:hypothetical protein
MREDQPQAAVIDADFNAGDSLELRLCPTSDEYVSKLPMSALHRPCRAGSRNSH